MGLELGQKTLNLHEQDSGRKNERHYLDCRVRRVSTKKSSNVLIIVFMYPDMMVNIGTL